MGTTKNGETRHVPILDVLLSHLREWRLQCPEVLVFPAASGRMLAPSARAFKDIFYRVVARAGFARIEGPAGERHYLNFHGLRHTFASLWMRKRGDLFRLQKLLGHKTIAMTQRYAHLAADAFESDLSRFGSTAEVEFCDVIPISQQVEAGGTEPS
jgi:integrase